MKKLLGRGAIGLVLAALLPTAAGANDTCNGFIDIDYIGPPILDIGDTVDVKITLATGSIQGGTKLQITSFQFNLDCNSNFPLTPPCTDEGPIVEYQGDGSIVEDCPGSFTSNVPGGGATVNQLIFTANPELDIPANVPTVPGFCSIQFTVKVLGLSVDGTPDSIEELVGYDVAACDNGVLVSGGFQTSAISTVPARHYGCYEVPRGNIPDQPVALVDRFGSTTAKVTEIKRVCAPTNKNNEDPTAITAPGHLTALTVGNVVGSFQKPKGLGVTNQFGNFTVDVVSPVLLMTPTSKSLVSPPPPLLPSSLQHFLCYKLDNVKGPKEQNGINVKDQFTDPFDGITLNLDKRGPFRLCVPVNKNSEDPSAPASPNALMCFTTSRDKLPFPGKDVFINNQFGEFKEFISQYDELCVPTSILP